MSTGEKVQWWFGRRNHGHWAWLASMVDWLLSNEKRQNCAERDNLSAVVDQGRLAVSLDSTEMRVWYGAALVTYSAVRSERSISRSARRARRMSDAVADEGTHSSIGFDGFIRFR